MNRGRLARTPAARAELPAGGSFTTNEMLEFWDARVGGALASVHYGSARRLGEATWALQDPRFVEEFVVYEAELNRFLPQHAQVVVCLYAIDRYRGEVPSTSSRPT